MIKKLLIKKAKKTFLEDQNREVIVSAEKIYFIEDTSKDYHCSDGVFNKADLAKSDTEIKSNTGKEFFIIDADFLDSYKGIKKLAQTIPLKDLGFILSEAGLNKTSVVVDAGAGSGGSTCFLARYAKKVYCYDINASNLEQAKQNAAYFQLKNIVFKLQDVYQKIPNKRVDLILLDLPEPWRVNAFDALKPGGYVVSYCPQITQTQRFVNDTLKKNFLHIKTIELVERDWKIDGLIVRPKSLTNIHSGFISIMRKIL